MVQNQLLQYDIELWWFGGLIYVIGSIMINLGSNLLRYSHEILRLAPEIERPPIWKRFWWMMGLLIFILGNAFNFCGFMFGSQSMLVALGSIQFISNVIFANFINDEQITRQAVVATMIIILGNVVAVMYGSKSTETHSITELYELLFEPLFLIYYLILTIITICLQLLYLYCQYNLKPKGISNAIIDRFIPFSYAAVSAIIGTGSVTLGKSLSGIVSDTIKSETFSQLKSIWPYLIFFLFVVLTVFWIYRMNSALRQYNALFIIPTLQALWLIFAILGGGIYYQEYLSMSWHEITMFLVGLFILLCGVAALPRATIEMKRMEDDEELVPLIRNPIVNKEDI